MSFTVYPQNFSRNVSTLLTLVSRLGCSLPVGKQLVIWLLRFWSLCWDGLKTIKVFCFVFGFGHFLFQKIKPLGIRPLPLGFWINSSTKKHFPVFFCLLLKRTLLSSLILSFSFYESHWYHFQVILCFLLHFSACPFLSFHPHCDYRLPRAVVLSILLAVFKTWVDKYLSNLLSNIIAVPASGGTCD